MGYIDISAEVVTFALSLALGAAICLMYDVVRWLHTLSVKGFAEVLVIDIVFWAAAAFTTFCFLIIRCNGFVRGYVLIGALGGFILTRMTVSVIFMKILSFVSRVFIKLRRAVAGIIRKLSAPCIKTLKKIALVIKKVLQHKAVLLYNLIRCIFVRKRSSENGCTDETSG